MKYSKRLSRVAGISSRSVPALAGVIWAGLAVAAPPAQTPPRRAGAAVAISAAELKLRAAWSEALARTPPPKKGCFQAQYPSRSWVEIPCVAPPERPYPPKHGPLPQTVGNGTDFSAQTPGSVSGATGHFENIVGVTSESDNGNANSFSLQLNSSFFNSPACAGHAGCLGWQQFIYSTSSGVFMQYWLINFGAGCPSGWFTFAPHCFRNSAGAATVSPPPTIADLGNMMLTGLAGSGPGAMDTVTLVVNGNAFSTQDNDNIVSLSQGWNTAEFNIIGDGNGSSADFNAGSTMNVRTSINTGSITAPNCILQGFTGETNNLTLVTAPAVITAVQWPSILFTQSNNPGGSATCATSMGDTHLTTFGGLLYDFQAQGDYVLAERGSDFIVQARQVSGAPNWPNASVNKAVAMKLGTNRIVIDLSPAQLVVNGVAKTLGAGQSLALPGGVRIAHLGNVYLVRRTNGDSVWTELNNGWINVAVSMARPSLASAQGLLVNPGNEPHLLAARGGTVFAEPISFNDLYHRYGDTWRVGAAESLFGKGRGVAPGNPSRPFHASALDRELFQRARSVCARAGVEPALLDACTLDIAVLKDGGAARGLAGAISPRRILGLDEVREQPEKR